jgi:hypothetical protein
VLEFLVPFRGVIMVDGILVSAACPNLLVQYFGKFTPFFCILITVMLHHHLVLGLCEVVLRRLIVIYKNTLPRLSLEIGIDETPTLDFVCTQQRGNSCFSLRVPQNLWLLIPFAHSLFLGSFQ